MLVTRRAIRTLSTLPLLRIIETYPSTVATSIPRTPPIASTDSVAERTGRDLRGDSMGNAGGVGIAPPFGVEGRMVISTSLTLLLEVTVETEVRSALGAETPSPTILSITKVPPKVGDEAPCHDPSVSTSMFEK
jgi:hypothetical protein